jgi:hypothetical protein
VDHQVVSRNAPAPSTAPSWPPYRPGLRLRWGRECHRDCVCPKRERGTPGVDLANEVGHARAAALNPGRFPFKTTDRKMERAARIAGKVSNLKAVTDEAALSEADAIIVNVGLDVEERPAFKVAPFGATLEAVARYMTSPFREQPITAHLRPRRYSMPTAGKPAQSISLPENRLQWRGRGCSVCTRSLRDEGAAACRVIGVDRTSVHYEGDASR